MKKIISIYIFSFILCASSLFDAIADDAKKAMQEYAGYDEIVQRGFSLSCKRNRYVSG